MFNLAHSHTTFHGGNYTQVNIQNNNQQQIAWDRLQSAVTPSAFHDSGDNFDALKCHPNTRIAIINELRDFALRRGGTGHAKILWLNGAAGAGKSAIARSLCEDCAATSSLLASFFFNRSDASRNNHKAFVATLTYQVYGYVPPHHQSLILGVIERDPLVFTRSIDAQLQALVVRPLFDLFQNKYFSAIGKCLIAIDGLDECSPAAAQLDILRAIRKLYNQVDFPFVFLVASRPEHQIQTFFKSPTMLPLIYRLELNSTYLPDVDIMRFLVDKLQEMHITHPCKNSLPCDWPSTRSIRALVHKSSGQFIYASVVVKYVTSARHQPHKRLEYVVNLCPPKGDLPFAELDALYDHILSSAENTDLALRLISYSISDTPLYPIRFTVEQLARIAGFDPDNCLCALYDLSSVLTVDTNNIGERIIRLSHKSFLDYLFESARSGKYYLNETQIISELIGKCFWYISNVAYTPESRITRYEAITFWNRHSRRLISNIATSYEGVMSFSLINCYNMLAKAQSLPAIVLFYDILWHDFFLNLLNNLRTLVGSEYAYLYNHYLNQFRELIIQHPDVYKLGSPKLKPWRVGIVVTLLILAKPSKSQLPAEIFGLIPNELSTSPDLDQLPYTIIPGEMGNLLCDAALQCFEFLSQDVNHSSAAAVLKYLAWALPYAAQSPELSKACGIWEPFPFATTPGANALSDLVQDIVTAIQEYRKRRAQNSLG